MFDKYFRLDQLQLSLVLSTELMMYIGRREESLKLTFRGLARLQRLPQS